FYRRAVLRRMTESRKGAMPAAETIAGTDAPSKPLRFVSLGANASPTTTLAGPWAAAVVYLAAGAAYALIMTASWFLATRDVQIGAIKTFFLFWNFYCPVDLVVILVEAPARAQQ